MAWYILPYNEDSLQTLDAYSASLSHASFMQSAAWGRFQVTQRKVFLLAEEKARATEPRRVILALRYSLPAGYGYWYLPRAPFVTEEKALKVILAEVRTIIKAQDKKALFVRFEPSGLTDLTGYRRTIDVQPSLTLLLNLKNDQEALLSAMHQKTRYNIRLAEKKGLTFKVGREDSEAFLDLLTETKERDGFRLHRREYYRSMIESGAVELTTAWYQETMLAGSLVASHGDTVTYVHGASSSQQRELMAPYFLQWHTILRAQASGYHWYDWHGIDEHKWPGVTRFKLGFGGQSLQYSGTFDAPLAPLAYTGYTVFRYLRRLF